jgi:hypothetical protein
MRRADNREKVTWTDYDYDLMSFHSDIYEEYHNKWAGFIHKIREKTRNTTRKIFDDTLSPET